MKSIKNKRRILNIIYVYLSMVLMYLCLGIYYNSSGFGKYLFLFVAVILTTIFWNKEVIDVK